MPGHLQQEGSPGHQLCGHGKLVSEAGGGHQGHLGSGLICPERANIANMPNPATLAQPLWQVLQDRKD